MLKELGITKPRSERSTYKVRYVELESDGVAHCDRDRGLGRDQHHMAAFTRQFAGARRRNGLGRIPSEPRACGSAAGLASKAIIIAVPEGGPKKNGSDTGSDPKEFS